MSTVGRRIISVTVVATGAIALLALIPLWLPVVIVVDLVRLRTRLPVARLLLFALGWSWLELAGVAIAALLWVGGQRSNRTAHYRLQAWWAANVLGVLRATTGIDVAAEGVAQLHPGPVVLLCRHASLADSLVSAWVISSLAGMQPRYVLKQELLVDPCLDIVGNRLPNHFLDRQAADSQGELDAITRMSQGMTDRDVAVIFPEGTRASPAKRERALDKLGQRDPARAGRLAALRHLLPPRPAGTAAMLTGAPDTDVVIGWHVGFDGLDTFGGILRHVAQKPPAVTFRCRRIPRREIPTGAAFTDWLDSVWLQADRDVHELLEGRAQ